MKNKENILLQKWIDGSITYAEERELDRLAQADPFLADALQGLREMPEQDHARYVASIKSRLQEQTREKRRPLIFYLPRVAAAAALVAALAFGLRYFVWNEKTMPDDVAMTQEQVKTMPKVNNTPIAEDEMTNETPETSGELPASEPKSAEPQKPISQLPAIAKVETEAMEEKEVQQDLRPNSYHADILTKEITKPDVAVPPSPPPPPPPPPIPEKKADMARDFARSSTGLSQDKNDISNLQATVTAPRTIRGKITDEQGLPLIGASILVKGTQIGAITDIEGTFQMTVPVGHKELIISYTGFLNQEIELGQTDTIAVQLDAGDMVLSEVVVTGLSKQRASQRAERAQVKLDKLPEPRKGFEKLKRYIRKNLQYPDAAKAQGIEGVVEVEFKVLPNGDLTNFVIRKSLGYGCDEEAIRLLREGPTWRLYSLQNDTMVYSIYFDLK